MPVPPFGAAYSYRDQYFIQEAREVAKASPDPRTKVGCVIACPANGNRYTGFNQFPRSFRKRDDLWQLRDPSPNLNKYDLSIHAEVVAMSQAAGPLHGWEVYCTLHPCSVCAALIAFRGLSKVLYADDLDPVLQANAQAEKAKMILAEAHIELVKVPST